MNESKTRKPAGFFPLALTLFALFVVALFFWIGLLLFLAGCRRTPDLAPLADTRERTQNILADALAAGQTNDFAGAGETTANEPSSAPANASALQAALAEQVLRLHIIADSNSDADQTVKLAVRDAVITYLEPCLDGVTTKQEAIDIIRGQLEELGDTANRVLAENGFHYTAKASLSRTYFPVKLYGDLVLPAGEYDALRICLGSASEKNWWCLVFPQLCFVDITTGTLPEDSKEELRALLTEEEYALVFPDETLAKSTATSMEFCEQTCRILFDYAPRETQKTKIRFPLLEKIKELIIGSLIHI